MTPEYRLYYDKHGKVITYTTENIPGDYLIINREQYAEANPNLMVINNQIADKSARLVTKYSKNLEQGTRTNKYDVNIIDVNSVNADYWAMEIYAIN